MSQRHSDAELRHAAEKRLQARAQASLGIDSSELPRLVHELHVHQIELEMQNSALQQTRSELEEALALYTELYDFAPVGHLTLDDQGLIAKINLAGAALLGRERSTLMHQRFAAFVALHDRERWNEHFLNLKTNDRKDSSELVLQRADGTRVDVQLDCIRQSAGDDVLARATPPAGGRRVVRIALIDITARKQAEAALIKAGALQNAIFNSANFSCIATDTRGVIQLFNVGAEHMLGYTAVEVVNQITPADLSDPQELVARADLLSVEFETPIAPGFEALVFKAAHGIEDNYELTYLCKDGNRLPARVAVTALRDDKNAIIGYLLIGTDNTARRRVEAEREALDLTLRERSVELERAKVVAEKANVAKSEFLSSMSHELRTPLGAILGFAQLIESGKPTPTAGQKRSIDQILKAGWYLLELINEILDLSLIESGKLSLSLEPVSLAEIMRECAAMIEPLANKRGIPISFAPFDHPLFVHADRTRVKQVLINLLSNAIKYNRTGGLVSVDCLPGRPGLIRIRVVDSGAGLAAEQIAQLFQPFNRLGQEAKVEQGTGIGLVVCKRLVELMGGVIGVESTVGSGSTFWVELNLVGATPGAVGVAQEADPDQPDSADDKPLLTLLYVEDNPANMMLVEDLIARRPDLRLLSATDGTRGIELARAARPDVILMDIHLPGISGIEALRILAQDSATAHIPVIAISANAMQRDIENGLQAGFFSYLTKPIKVSEFMSTLDEALKFAKTGAPDRDD